MKPLSLRTICAATALACASAAYAQPAQVDISSGEDWEHEWTAMEFPAVIGGFERGSITAFEERETNISARYTDDKTRTILSLYIYRPGNPSTSIWFDRALIAIGVTEDYGSVDLERVKIGRFVPSGGEAESGLSAVLAVNGPMRSTGVALYRSGEWLVKVRISSEELSVSQMDALLRTTLADLPALDQVDGESAKFVGQCSDTLSYEDAQLLSENLGAGALAAALSAAAEQNIAREEAAGQDKSADREELGLKNTSGLAYCREGERNQRFNLFRPLDGSDRYSLALGDAGFSVEVYPSIVMTELREEDDATVYTVRTASGTNYSFHTPFLGRPSPPLAAQSALQGPTISSVSRPLGDDDVAININSEFQ